MAKKRLDVILTEGGYAPSREKAKIMLMSGIVYVNGEKEDKPGTMFNPEEIHIEVRGETLRYVSRGGLKLEKALAVFPIDLQGKICMDIGASTGGFTDFALQHGAKKVVAVDVGTDQLHPKLRANERVELHEKTDIRNFSMVESPDIVVIDVSFISLRQILPHVATLCGAQTKILAMVKPQFEATRTQLSRSGVIKNDNVRREILREFEQWAKERFVVCSKADSDVKGARGNQERFYVLQIISKR